MEKGVGTHDSTFAGEGPSNIDEWMKQSKNLHQSRKKIAGRSSLEEIDYKQFKDGLERREDLVSSRVNGKSVGVNNAKHANNSGKHADGNRPTSSSVPTSSYADQDMTEWMKNKGKNNTQRADGSGKLTDGNRQNPSALRKLSYTGLDMTEWMENEAKRKENEGVGERNSFRSTRKYQPVYCMVHGKFTLEDNPKDKLKLEAFIEDLQDHDFEVETVPYSQNENILFTTIGAADSVYGKYAEEFDIPLDCENTLYRPHYCKPTFKFTANALTDPKPDHKDYQRAQETFTMEFPTKMTNAEKIMVTHSVLMRSLFGIRWNERGLERLQSMGIITDAFPLHDGTSHWATEGPLNDRQILRKYWGTMHCFWKEQPIQLIHQYFGCEMAFFYSFYGFFIKMLLPISLLSLICFMLGSIFLWLHDEKAKAICNSKLVLCPECDFTKCKFLKINKACLFSYLTILCDNGAIIVLAFIMSAWTTVVIELWRRKEAIRKLQWNLHDIVSDDITMRAAYESQAFPQKINITGEMEPIIPRRVVCFRYALTVSVISFSIILVLLATFAVMIYRSTIVYTYTGYSGLSYKTLNFIASLTGSFMSAIFILSFEAAYYRIASWLTSVENPRSEQEYDNSYILKSFALTFVNNYAVTFYIAFVKYRFYTYPGDEGFRNVIGRTFMSDTCDPAGCITDLFMHLLVIMTLKRLPNIFTQIILPQILIHFQARMKGLALHPNAPRWERDYRLLTTSKYYLIKEYIEIFINYGFLTFFVSGCPIAPILALMFSLIDLRLSSFNFVTSFRRPVPVRIENIGIWDDILHFVTFVSVITNAFAIAFTTEFVWREVYQHLIDSSLQGFLNRTISEYRVTDWFKSNGVKYDPKYNVFNVTYCYYLGHRYPPNHEKRYQNTKFYYVGFAGQLLTVLLIEHAISLIRAIVAYSIPDIPPLVKECVMAQEQKLSEERSVKRPAHKKHRHHKRMKKRLLSQFRTYDYLS